MSACIRTVNKSGSFTGFLAKNQQTKYNWRMRPLGLSIPSMVHWIMCMAFRFSQSILRFAWTKSYNSVWHSIQQWISCIPRAKDKAPIWMASQLTPPKPKKWVFKEFLFLFFLFSILNLIVLNLLTRCGGQQLSKAMCFLDPLYQGAAYIRDDCVKALHKFGATCRGWVDHSVW